MDVTHLSRSQMREHRRTVSIVFQDPAGSLDPRMLVGEVVAEPLRLQGKRLSKRERSERVDDALRRVGLRPEVAKRYPHELSGGQRQRVSVARALISEPTLLVADEPTSALDVSVQASVLNLLADLQRDIGFACLFITHDLSAVEYLADDIAVMYLGQLMEQGPREEIFARPRHPYTQALLAAAPVANPAVQRSRTPVLLGDDLPSAINPPSGCRFHTRCPLAVAKCAEEVPPLRPSGRAVAACHLVHEDGSAPDIRQGRLATARRKSLMTFTTRPTLEGTFGMVSSTHWIASQCAMRILELGGNAFDAAVTAGFVLHVVEPHLNGPGGEVPAIVATSDDPTPRVLCGQGPAPSGATIEHYRSEGLDLVPGSGPLAAAVPGAVDAWLLLLRDKGTQSLSDVLGPAIDYAEHGHPLMARVSSTGRDGPDLFTSSWHAIGGAVAGGRPGPGSRARSSSTARTPDTLQRLVEEGEASGGSREHRSTAARRAWREGFVAEASTRSRRRAFRDSSGEATPAS